MSSIIEVKLKEKEEEGESFVSFETMVETRDEPVGPTPLELAEEKLGKVQQETTELVASTNADVERIKKEAYDAGFAAGEAEGRKVGQAAFDKQIALVAEQIVTLAGERQQVQQVYEADILTLIRAMVEKLVNHEVSVNSKVIEACLAKAMTYVVGQSKVMVHLNPEDFLIIKDVVMENPLFLKGAGRVELMEDLAISQGGCLLATEFGEIDATLEHCKSHLDQAVGQAFLAALSEE